MILGGIVSPSGSGSLGPGCQANTRPFPAELSTVGILPSLLKEVVSCGPVAKYYPQSDTCTSYSNILVNPPIVGGCAYDMGIGPCLNDNVYSYSQGCASQVEDFLVNQVLPVSYVIVGMVFLNIISAYLSFVLFIKRKENDVFPELYPEHKVGWPLLQYQLLIHSINTYVVLT